MPKTNIAACAAASGRRIGEPTTTRMPSRISWSIGSLSSTAGGGGSGRRIDSSSRAEPTNEMASMAIAMGAVRSWTRKPLRASPMNSAADALASSALFAATRRARATIVGM